MKKLMGLLFLFLCVLAAPARAQATLRTSPNGVYQFIKVNRFTDPSAGVGLMVIAPAAGQCWRIITGHFKLVTSATAANREAIISFQDQSGEPYGPTGPNLLQTASQTIEYIFMPGMAPAQLTASGIGAFRQIPIASDTWIGQGGSAAMIVNVGGIQAGDQLSDFNMEVEQRACIGTL